MKTGNLACIQVAAQPSFISWLGARQGFLNSIAGQTVPLLNTVNRTWPLALSRDAIPSHVSSLETTGKEAQFAQEKPWKSAT